MQSECSGMKHALCAVSPLHRGQKATNCPVIATAPGLDYPGSSATARITRPRAPHLEHGASGSMANPPCLTMPSVVMVTCRSDRARAVAMHCEQNGPGSSLRNSAISLWIAAGTSELRTKQFLPHSLASFRLQVKDNRVLHQLRG